MRYANLLGRTLRQAPADAETPGHQLILRAGLVQQFAAGVYSLLPLGWRATLKIERILREELDAIGAQEVRLPSMQPAELWEASGRLATYDPPLFIVQDRRERNLALAPTAEEAITSLFKQQVQSYRELPILAYQIQNKFRNEVRARGGLIRLREFIMKDAYSFHANWDDLGRTYDECYRVYSNVFRRCGVDAVAVDADSGGIGGKDSQQFMHLTDAGDDTVLICGNCGYAASDEKADHKKRDLPAEQAAPLEEVATPGQKTIDDLVSFLGVPHYKTLKAVFYAVAGAPVFVAIRGDLEVNEIKLRNALGGAELRLMDDRQVEAAGLVAGSASPVGLKERAKRAIRIVADDSVLVSHNLVAGANKPDTHLRNVNYERDWQADIVTDISLARQGDACSRCEGGTLSAHRGIEVGHIFKLGTVYTDKLEATFLDQDGKQVPAVMGCYGIGVDRLLGTIVEANHDERGIIWPREVAPFAVHLVALKPEDAAVRHQADLLYDQLLLRGVEVLYDDREESPGVKFADADLLGMPLRVTVSPRTLESASVELKRRAEKETTLVPVEEAIDRVTAAVGR
jgi:prolyl-tRNA synthetase